MIGETQEQTAAREFAEETLGMFEVVFLSFWLANPMKRTRAAAPIASSGALPRWPPSFWCHSKPPPSSRSRVQLLLLNIARPGQQWELSAICGSCELLGRFHVFGLSPPTRI